MTRLLLLVAALAAAPAAAAQDWQLVWSDEFDADGAPDPAKWAYDVGGNGWGNQERQFYTDRPENARVEDGALVIEAREESYEGSAYTSARLVTRGKASWTYGRIEARLKLPEGQGIWPAFWMLASDSPYGGWPFSGEIDVMEFLGHDVDAVYGTLHYGGGTYGPCRGSRGGVTGHCYSGTSTSLASGAFPDDFHTFAIEWAPREIRWLLDGEVYQTQSSWYSGNGAFPAPFDAPFHLLLNVAVGGQWPGYPDETTVFPQRMLVDYVRVYQDAAARPTVALEGVEDGAVIASGGSLDLAASADDADGVESVAFLQDDGVLGADDEAPYGLTLDGLADGCYQLRARATDAVGYEMATDPVTVTVGEGCPAGAAWPYLMRPIAVPGRIEAEHFDLGGPDVAYRDLTEANTGAGIRQSEGVDVAPSGDAGGGDDVTDVNAREWLTYTVDVEATARYRVLARIASGSGGTLRLSVDGVDAFGDVGLPPTGGDAVYGNALVGALDLAAGRHVLRVDARSSGFSLNWLQVSAIGATDVEDDAPSGLGLRVSPNPAGRRATVAFSLPAAGTATVDVLDAVGRRVLAAASGARSAGPHEVALDLGALAPGVYTVRVVTEAGVRSSRLSVVR